MKLIMMWLWTTTWYYKKHHETTCKSMRHFLPTTQPSVSYFKWLWWICSNDASNAGVDAVGKPSRRVAPIASSPGKVITAPGVTPVMRKALSFPLQLVSSGEIWLPLRGIHGHPWVQWCHSTSSNLQKKPIPKNRVNKRFWLTMVAFIWTCGNLPVFQLHPLLLMWFVESLTFFNMRSYGLQPSRPSVPIPELQVLEPLVACRWRFHYDWWLQWLYNLLYCLTGWRFLETTSQAWTRFLFLRVLGATKWYDVILSSTLQRYSS